VSTRSFLGHILSLLLCIKSVKTNHSRHTNSHFESFFHLFYSPHSCHCFAFLAMRDIQGKKSEKNVVVFSCFFPFIVANLAFLDPRNGTDFDLDDDFSTIVEEPTAMSSGNSTPQQQMEAFMAMLQNNPALMQQFQAQMSGSSGQPVNAQGTGMNPQGMSMHPQGMSMHPQGMSTNAHPASMQATSCPPVNPQGIGFAPQASYVCPPSAVGGATYLQELRMEQNKKSAKKEKKEGMKGLIWKAVKNNFFRGVKIIKGEDTEKKLAYAILDWLALPEFVGCTPQILQNRATWVETYGSICTGSVNKLRGHVGGRLKAGMNKFDTEGKIGGTGSGDDDTENATDETAVTLQNRKLPTKEDVLKCLKREIDWSDDWERAVFIWCWDTMLAYAAANKNDWSPQIRYYNTITLAKNNRCELLMPSSTEALVVWFLENNEERWPAQDKVKKKHPNKKQVPCLKKNGVTQTTNSVSGRRVLFAPKF